jgi:hypothetical protein
MPPAPRQPSSEQVTQKVAASPQGQPRRSDSAQRKLNKASPTQKEKKREKTGSDSGSRSSTSKLFSGLLGKRTSSDKLNKNADQKRNVAGTVNPQQLAAQAPSQAPPQQMPQPQQAPRQVSQQNFQGQPQQQAQQAPQGYQNPQDRGRQLQREPQYEQPPIPGGYNLVRGDGNMLAPTSYNPRGMQYGGYGPQQPQDPRMYQQQQQQQYAYQPRQMQHQQSYPPQGQQYQGPSQPQFVTQHPNLSSQSNGHQQSQSPNNRQKVTRPLSSEDLLARSPARPQFGQQAPYQLTLPEPDHDSETEDEPLPVAPRAAPAPKVASLPRQGEKPPTVSPERNFSAAGPINTGIKMSTPSLRHPMSPATYPLPENTLFSPVNPSAQNIPPPPPPKNWPQGQGSARQVQTPEPQQGLDRSNTINTHASEISQLSGNSGNPHESLSVPRSGMEQGNGKGRVEEEGSPQITPQGTPERSPENTSSQMTRRVDEDNIYDTSPPPPRNRVAPPQSPPRIQTQQPASTPPQVNKIDTTNVSRPGTASAMEKQLAESPDQRAERRREQEEKILVDGQHPNGHGLSVEDEERATMSATSYPGQECMFPHLTNNYDRNANETQGIRMVITRVGMIEYDL